MGKGIEGKDDDRGGSGKTPFVNFSIFVFSFSLLFMYISYRIKLSPPRTGGTAS